MYKVILLDDEQWSLHDLERLIPWEEHGFGIVMSTTKPWEAYDFILENSPDLLITDIRMPGLTGTELTRNLRKQGSDIEIVIVSGYSDFEYARQAISDGVAEYSLKPVKATQLIDILEQLQAKIEEKNTIKGILQEIDAPGNEKEVKWNHDQFDKMIRYIDEHFAEQLRLKELASQYYLNANYCCSLFKKYLGITFSRYVSHLRIEKAKSLLHEGRYSISEIADKVGCRDYSYFNKLFKKITGVTPKAFKKK